MKTITLILALLCATSLFAEVPQSVPESWASFDPHAEPLEIEVIRETVKDGLVLRQLRYVVGTFAKKKTRCAAFYAFPQGAKNLPAIVQIHGGGQRARPQAVLYWASQGYAAISINWGEHVIGEKDDPNTDWAGIPAGFLDPKHHNDVSPGEGTIHSVPHPWNSSWLLYSAAARRAITLLEKAPEADGNKVGVTGHSMGGRLTVLTAIDPRIKAASPSVGGSGYLYDDILGIPNSARRMTADRALYNQTLDCRHYWPLIQCPLMFLGATNDFNSPMEKVIQGFRTLPNPNGAMSFTPHMNHRFTADNYAARVRWFDAHLKGTFVFPKTAIARLELNPGNGIPQFEVTPDRSSPHALKSVTIFYGYDRDPRARFWRAAKVTRDGDRFYGDCPVMDLREPLYAFANVTYDTGSELNLPPGMSPSSLLTLTSDTRLAFPDRLKAAGVNAVLKNERLIEDFSRGWQDWSLVGVNHRPHWNYETHKLNDPAFVGPRGGSLVIELETQSTDDTLAVILETDRWRGYTGRKVRQYAAIIPITATGEQTLTIATGEFITPEGEVLDHYDFVTSLILTPAQKAFPKLVEKEWKGPIPTFKNIRWEGGTYAPRPRPYLALGAAEVDPDAAFRAEFDSAVDESVEREDQDRN